MKTHDALTCVALLILCTAWNTASGQSGAGRAIEGTVYDSLDARPLSGAHVLLLARSDSTDGPRAVVADALGRFSFRGLAAGAYLLGFEDPLIDSLGISVASKQIQLAASGSPLVVTLAVPGPRTVHDAFCQRSSTTDSSSVLIGHLSDASDRGVVVNGVVTAEWLAVGRSGKRINTGWRSDSALSGTDGSYVLCGLPAAAEVAVIATSASNASGVVRILTSPTTGVVRREFYLVNDTALRDGRITGIVESDSGRSPIAHAQVHIEGDTAVATTGPDGRFTLRHVPYGTLAVAARHVGYVPQEIAVDVFADAPGHVTFAMARTATLLDAVRTVADPTGFEQRRAAGWGRYFDSDDIQRMGASDVYDIVRSVAGVRETGLGFHAQVLMRPLFWQRGEPLCAPYYYLDGRRLPGVNSSEELEMFVKPQDLAGVEVYVSPIATPQQFRDLTAVCGSIVMWTIPPNQRITGKSGR